MQYITSQDYHLDFKQSIINFLAYKFSVNQLII